ncbi:MAG: DEAD/DEAH box helicase family protein [Peptococcaceae bacterium]|nr:DEAD/DEAH box helicase family protein [Peptococcaceae bacterium]
MLFYTLINDSGEVRFSPAPEVDKLLGNVTVLNLRLPLEVLWRNLEEIIHIKPSEIPTPLEELKSRIVNRLKPALEKEGNLNIEEFEWDTPDTNDKITNEKCRLVLGNERLFTDFIARVQGRQLAEGELTSLRGSMHCDEQTITVLMQKAVLTNHHVWVPAIRRIKGYWVCQRCGSIHCQEWTSIYGYAATCQECKSIGPLNSLQVLFRCQPLQNQNPQKVKHHTYPFDFSPSQKRAAEQLLELSQKDGVHEILVWAACGAGKTEVSFPAIRKYLSEGKRVLFAAPRQDVVHDVQLRLQRSFPDHMVKILSGAAAPDWEDSLLIVATTHQLLRFYRAFSLVVFDEMDAYPYAGNKILEFGLKQAIREDGRLIYLTATPSEELLKKFGQEDFPVIRLPLRYHGRPVPIPEWIEVNFPDKNLKNLELSDKPYFITLSKVLRELAQDGPLLVFVPTISLVPIWTEILKKVFSNKRVEGSWSSDPHRRTKVSSFLKGSCDVFICTSILERGITVNKVQVAVLFAHHEQYDIRSLVQMAGRTGRTSENPTGRAVFFAPRKTREMIRAIDWIREQNSIAKGGSFHEE